jgi:hypothetical protein
VEAPTVKLAAAMEGERTTHTVPTHTSAESTTAESAAHTVCTHITSMRAHSTTAPAHTTTVSGHTTTVSATTTVSTTTVSTTTVSATTTVSTTAAATSRRNSWGKGDRCTDYGGDGNGHEGLSKHGSVSSRWRATPTGPILVTAAYVRLTAGLPETERLITLRTCN